MKKIRIVDLFVILAIASISISACGSNANGVASLGATPTPDAETGELDDEARAMAFTQCMREQGFLMEDPKVDADGNVEIPKPEEGLSYTKEDIRESYQACEVHLEGITFERKRADKSEKIDYFMELAVCLREGGYEVDDPTAETLEIWLVDFRVEFDWDDPGALAVFEDCEGVEFKDEGQGKEK